MSDFSLDYESLSSKIKGAKNILILLPANPHFNQVAAALSLYLSFKKMGKEVLIGCPTAMTVAFNALVGVDKITSKIGNRNLVISFDYNKDAVEKASYNIEDNKLKIIVEPKPGSPPIDFNKVSFSYEGVVTDIIIIVGASRLEDLQTIYEEEKQVFDDNITVNIDVNPQNTKFGKINLVDKQASSCAEVVGFLIKKTGWAVDEDVVTNLYLGIREGSGNFESEKVRAETFEIAAWCIKKGAKKSWGGKNAFFSEGKSFSDISPLTLGKTPSATIQDSVPKRQPILQEETSSKDLFVSSSPKRASDQNQSLETVENKDINPPPDWFKPKIFKGRTEV